MPFHGCGCSSGVEHNLAKVGVEGSNPFARSKILKEIKRLKRPFGAVFAYIDARSSRCKHSVSSRRRTAGYGGVSRDRRTGSFGVLPIRRIVPSYEQRNTPFAGDFLAAFGYTVILTRDSDCRDNTTQRPGLDRGAGQRR